MSNTPKEYIRSIRYIIGDYIKHNNIACGYCGRQYNKKNKISIDHIIPKSSGGTVKIDNIIFCCTHCNNIRKGNKTLEEFLTLFPKAKFFLRKYLNKIRKVVANGLNYYEQLEWITKYL